MLAVPAEPCGYGTPLLRQWDDRQLVHEGSGFRCHIARVRSGVAQFSAVAPCLFCLTLVLLTALSTGLAFLAVEPLTPSLGLVATAQRLVALFGANGHAALMRNADTLASLVRHS